MNHESGLVKCFASKVYFLCNKLLRDIGLDLIFARHFSSVQKVVCVEDAHGKEDNMQLWTCRPVVLKYQHDTLSDK